MIKVFQTLIFIEKLLLHLRTAGWSRIQYYIRQYSFYLQMNTTCFFIVMNNEFVIFIIWNIRVNRILVHMFQLVVHNFQSDHFYDTCYTLLLFLDNFLCKKNMVNSNTLRIFSLIRTLYNSFVDSNFAFLHYEN